MDELSLLLKKHNFKFSKKYGQNFLDNKEILSAIVKKSGISKETPVLEIGCGAGTLTRVLCEASKYVYGYEIDETLMSVLGESLKGIDNCDITFKDIMREDVKDIERRIGETYMLIANLPYYITSQVLMKFVENSVNCSGIVITVQDEVARRLCASASTSDYGAITAGINLVARSERLFGVGKEYFYPVPKVDSAVVKITFERDKYKGVDRKLYRDTVRAAFSSRRKTLLNNLSGWLGCPKDKAEELLKKSGIDILARGETLESGDFVRLAENIGTEFFKK